MIQLVDIGKITALHAAEIHKAVADVVDSGWYLKGHATAQFEHDYAQYVGTQHCVACGNGLDALTLIMRAYMELGVLHEGDEVIVPANAYIACMISITRCKLTPVLVEPRIDTLQIDDSAIEHAITPHTRAIMIVHMYGRCAYTSRIADICRQHNLKLIEDVAQAHGCRFAAATKAGSLGDAAAHSFYPTKNLGALGDAGAVTTNDAPLADMVRALGNYGSERKYVFSYIGVNSRMDEIQAAVLSVKLKYLDAENERRRNNAHYYIEHIKHKDILLPTEEYWRNSVFHIFPVLTPHREELRQYLADNGVQTDVHYPLPPHQQRAYKEWACKSLPVTERIHREELSLPVSQVVSDAEREHIAQLINEFCL